jgi:tripartite-type tricarboxylate transporter receptor subunit TctC
VPIDVGTRGRCCAPQTVRVRGLRRSGVDQLAQALADPTVRERFADLGRQIFSPEQQTPEALAAFQRAEIEKWWPILKEAGIKAQ